MYEHEAGAAHLQGAVRGKGLAHVSPERFCSSGFRLMSHLHGRLIDRSFRRLLLGDV